ncbi:MAG: DUF1700 domain-containing protein [bacterium]|nr:DUF1700 domain-containing protein [bacterium]
MSKEQFLNRLEQLLYDIPKEEKEEALRYYQDYFEDAVDVDEEKLIKEIGTPEKVARQIKVNLYNKASKDAGVYTETGYSNAFYEDEKEEIDLIGKQQNQQNDQQAYSNGTYQNTGYGNAGYDNTEYSNQRTKRSSSDILLIIILVLTCPIWGGVGFSVVIGLAATVFGLTVGFGAAFLGLMIGGVVLVVTGVAQLFVNPLAGMLLIGCGFILLALAICFFSIAALIVTKLIPAIVKGIQYVWRRLFGRRERA